MKGQRSNYDANSLLLLSPPGQTNVIVLGTGSKMKAMLERYQWIL